MAVAGRWVVLLAIALVTGGCLDRDGDGGRRGARGDDSDAADDRGLDPTAEPPRQPAPTAPVRDPPATAPPDDPWGPGVDARVRMTGDGTVEIDVPVHVLLIGFDPGVAEALRDRLTPERVAAGFGEDVAVLPPREEDVGKLARQGGNPMVPTAVFRVHDAGPAWSARLLAAVARTALPDRDPPVYDANAVEDLLADELLRAGFPLRPEAATLVLLHGGDVLVEGHAYRYTYFAGFLEPVRAFGERHPFVVMDVSAREDPWVTTTTSAVSRSAGHEPAPREHGPYDEPVPAGGEATVAALEQAARDAAWVRLLQGHVFVTPTATCHAVTAILALRAGSLGGTLPGHPEAQSYFDAARLEAAFEHVTGAGTVFLDVRVIELPQDDPGLEVISRPYFVGYPAQIAWMDLNWDRYWVPHDGCEPYVTLIVLGDPAEPWDAGYAVYDHAKGHRICISYTSELSRLMYEDFAPGEEPTGIYNEQVTAYDFINAIAAHETTHLFGAAHSHDVFHADGTYREVPGFSSVWSAMSYHLSGQTADFGVVDATNYQRNRAGWAIHGAVQAGLQDTPGFQRALERLGTHDWKGAADALAPLDADA